MENHPTPDDTQRIPTSILTETACPQSDAAPGPAQDAETVRPRSNARDTLPAEAAPAEAAPAEAAPAEAAPAEAEPARPRSNARENAPWPKAAFLARAHQAEARLRSWRRDFGDRYDVFDFAFNFRAGGSRVHIVYDELEIPQDLWFVGDLHGDLLALEAALSHIDAHSELPPTIVFLGDLFDRFDYGLEVVMRVLALVIERPGKILWIAGNHDDGLFYDDLNRRFASRVLPAEFADFLNAHEEYHDFGKWLVGLCQQLPRALVLPDGLFVAHGGCPSFDMNTFGYAIDDLHSVEDLERPDILRTFIWNRVIPDQNQKSGDEVGKDDLVHFFAGLERLIGFPLKRMLRGHDHCRESRHQYFDHYAPEAPVLTLATMSAWYLGTDEFPPELMRTLRKQPVTTPAIARYRHGDLPAVTTLDIPAAVVAQFHSLEELTAPPTQPTAS